MLHLLRFFMLSIMFKRDSFTFTSVARSVWEVVDECAVPADPLLLNIFSVIIRVLALLGQ